MGDMTIKSPLTSILIFLIAIAIWRQFFYIVQQTYEFPMNNFIRSRTIYKEVIRVVETELNCGLKQSCPENSFPIFLSTGMYPENKPQLCIGGKYIIKPAEKGEGRGLNTAIVEPKTFEVIAVKNFDTYLSNKSIEISEWAEGIRDDDIIIVFTYDEASTRLGGETKALFNELGSGKVQNLQFRSQWYMITQKGSRGFTTYEKLTYSKKKNWGEKIELRGCIPRKIPKKITTADEPLKESRRKIQFCEGKTEDKYKGFCNEPRFEIIMPALLTNKSLVGNLAYTLPIFLYASSNLEILVSSLDSLIHQPGIVVSLITLLYEDNSTDIPSLAKIYGIRSSKTKFAKTFEGRLTQSKMSARKLFPAKKYLIVIDSEVIPSPDFLFFMAQIIPTMEKDECVSVISGWSSNCYKKEGNVHLAYRIRGTPKYAALISDEFENDFHGEIYAPDVARVQGPEACHLPSLEPNNWIERPQDLQKNRYFHKMIMLQQLGQVIEVTEILINCSQDIIKNETNVIYVPPENTDLSKILSCLGVQNGQYGQYDGIVRLFVGGKNVLMELSKNDTRTSNEIGLAYSPARTVTYEKQPLHTLPAVRMGKSYRPGTIYTPSEGLKTTYNETYTIPISEENVNNPPSKLMKQHREYSKLGKYAKPMNFGLTEYREEYPLKELSRPTKGVSVEEETTCPMITTGRDERDPLPLTQGYNKYLDIYLSTSRLTHRAFTLHEQQTLAMKDIVTSQETMEIPKGRGFGCKFPAFPGQDLDNRDKNMVDKALFHTEGKLRFIPKGMPKVPNFGSESESETHSAYTKPEGWAVPKLFSKFVEFPQTIGSPTAKQTLCAPGMYSTESSAINNHISPQAVV